MIITSFKVSQYRSIYGEITTDSFNGLTIVGQNNSGKTNLLSSIKLFFEGKADNNLYNYATDYPNGAKKGQTNFAVKFAFSQEELAFEMGTPNIEVLPIISQKFEDDDDEFEEGDEFEDDDEFEEENNFHASEENITTKHKPRKKSRANLSLREQYLELFEMLDDNRITRAQNEITIHLTISNQNNFSYSVFKGYKRKSSVAPSTYSARERSFIEKLLSSFECVYIPSSKQVEEIYQTLLLPFIRKEIFNAITPAIQQINKQLESISGQINDEIVNSGIQNYKLKIHTPDTEEDVVGNFKITILDSIENDISSKGTGIQCLSYFSSFKSIAHHKSSLGKRIIWMIEEPESFLHPSLCITGNKIFQSLQKDSDVIIATHSLSFVNDDVNKIIELFKDNHGHTKDKKHKKKIDAIQSIRDNLGIKFIDFFNLSTLTLFVEGTTDKRYISEILNILKAQPENVDKWPHLATAEINEFGGISGLGAFLKGVYKFIYKEVPIVAMFDGDDAGIKERKALQNYFGNQNIPFEANKQYVSIRYNFAVEGLFPDHYIKEIADTHKSWFKNGLSLDASGTVEPFTIEDTKKIQFLEHIMDKCRHDDTSNWNTQWIVVLDAIEEAFKYQINQIQKTY